jgi:hypothetical protein
MSHRRFSNGLIYAAFALASTSVLLATNWISPLNFSWGVFFPLIVKQYPESTPAPDGLLISEVLYRPIGLEPDGEWIEIFNSSSLSLSLREYKVGDAEVQGDREGMYQFPEGATLEASGVIVVANRASTFIEQYGFFPDYELVETIPSVPNLLRYIRWASYNLELTNDGDEVLLLDGEDHLIDAVSWGHSTFAMNPPPPIAPQGYSLERKPANVDTNQSSDWVNQPDPAPKNIDLNTPTPTPTQTPTPTRTASATPTASPKPCGFPHILISEVLYDPLDTADPLGEWLELYNPDNVAVDLSCLFVGDEETEGGGEGMLAFPSNATLPGGAVAIIAYQAQAFLGLYGFLPDYELS